MMQTMSLTTIRLLLFIIYSLFCASSATDTLNQGDLFNYSSTPLVSRNGNFSLGFSGGYLMINSTLEGYKSHPVWIANRENSILDDSGVLTIDESGKLKITFNGGNPIELYPGLPTSPPSKVSAVLKDDGNFVLQQEGNSAEQPVLWNSFENPTDVLFPGMKLGNNLRLTSWLAESNPSPGAFTLEWDSNERQLIMKRRGIRYWTSGVMSPENSFENIFIDPSSGKNYKFSLSNDGLYLSYELDSNQFTLEEFKKFSMWILDYEGRIREPYESRRPVYVTEICDGNSTERGCVRWEAPKCRRQGDSFRTRIGNIGPERQRRIDNDSMSFSDCKDFCWNNCECTAIRYFEGSNSTGCTYYVGPIDDQGLTGNEPMYQVIIPGPPSKDNRVWIWVVSAAIISIATLGSILLYLRWRRLKLEEKFLQELMTSDKENDASELENGENRTHNLQVFSVASIMSATNSFSPQNKLGEGGFGPVYKGELEKGQEIAVKRLSRSSGQGLVEFKNELIVIAKLQHRNLVRLLGLCIQGEERLLIYEYMPNKSLDSFIFDQSKRELLDWNKRFDIIEGIAQGLLYLHKYSRLRIIHRDMKASNILLDKDMNPKISDFGMARIFKTNESEANTCRIVGTYGYMSPEYAMEGNFSEKSDVYSFGVLVLEIISGKKNQNIHQQDRLLNLLGYALELWREGNGLELVDPIIKGTESKDQVLRSINVALLCVEHNPEDRPTMSAVLSMLTGDIQHIPPPKLPAFYVGRGIGKISMSQENWSANGLSITDINGR